MFTFLLNFISSIFLYLLGFQFPIFCCLPISFTCLVLSWNSFRTLWPLALFFKFILYVWVSYLHMPMCTHVCVCGGQRESIRLSGTGVRGGWLLLAFLSELHNACHSPGRAFSDQFTDAGLTFEQVLRDWTGTAALVIFWGQVRITNAGQTSVHSYSSLGDNTALAPSCHSTDVGTCLMALQTVSNYISH